MLKRILRHLRRDEKGITGLETAIILIAFVVVAAVFAYTVLSAGLFSTQKSSEAVYAGLEEAQSSLELKGTAVAGGLCLLENAEDAWVAAASVTATVDNTVYVEDSGSSDLVIADGFTTGVAAYEDITSGSYSLDLSDNTSVTFWIRSSGTHIAGVFQLRLSEADDGTGTTENLTVPAIAVADTWYKATVALSGTTTSYDAVKSIALYAASDPGAVTINIDAIETQPILSTGNPMKAYADELVVTISNAVAGEPIDFSTTTDADSDGYISDESTKNHKIIVSYNDEYQTVNDLAWTISAVGYDDTDNLLEGNEKFVMTIDLSRINNLATTDAQKIGANRTFNIEIKSPNGAVLPIERTMPGKIVTINDVY